MFKTHRTFNLTTGVKNNSIAVVKSQKYIFVIYHETCVVKASSTHVTLDNGGWNTVSTRLVMNRALELLAPGAFVFTKKGETLVQLPGEKAQPFKNGVRIERSVQS
jgi:pectin methylesterase-like acyl-CoA thioesterase